jgi:ferredoxin
VFGVLCAVVAHAKNRNPAVYFVVGLFLGIIGLIITLVEPSLRIESPSCKYFRSDGNPLVQRGTLQATLNGVQFVPKNRQYALDIPFNSIRGAQIYDKRTAPKNLLVSQTGKSATHTMLSGENELLEITHDVQGQQAKSYFSINKNVIQSFVQQVVGPGTQREMQVQQAQQAYKRCPYCAENIMADAVVCRYCGKDLTSQPVQATAASPNHKISHDIVINGQIAFKQGEAIEIEAMSPDPNRPDYKYVVTSKSLGQKFRLSDGDLFAG